MIYRIPLDSLSVAAGEAFVIRIKVVSNEKESEWSALTYLVRPV